MSLKQVTMCKAGRKPKCQYKRNFLDKYGLKRVYCNLGAIPDVCNMAQPVPEEAISEFFSGIPETIKKAEEFDIG